MIDKPTPCYQYYANDVSLSATIIKEESINVLGNRRQIGIALKDQELKKHMIIFFSKNQWWDIKRLVMDMDIEKEFTENPQGRPLMWELDRAKSKEQIPDGNGNGN